jgi:hypothetical protein
MSRSIQEKRGTLNEQKRQDFSDAEKRKDELKRIHARLQRKHHQEDQAKTEQK